MKMGAIMDIKTGKEHSHSKGPKDEDRNALMVSRDVKPTQ
jgi:hypothetical protein